MISRQMEWLGANTIHLVENKNLHFVVKWSFEPLFFYIEVVRSYGKWGHIPFILSHVAKRICVPIFREKYKRKFDCG